MHCAAEKKTMPDQEYERRRAAIWGAKALLLHTARRSDEKELKLAAKEYAHAASECFETHERAKLDDKEWERMEYAGDQRVSKTVAYEHRNCPCGSTLAKPVRR